MNLTECNLTPILISHGKSPFHIWTTLIKLLFMSEYGFCPMNDNQDGRQNGYPIFTGIKRGPLWESDCSSLK